MKSLSVTDKLYAEHKNMTPWSEIYNYNLNDQEVYCAKLGVYTVYNKIKKFIISVSNQVS